MNKIDFEHAGLEFVAGDRFSSGIGLPTIVEEFSWRTNTGVKPEFSGKCDAIVSSGQGINNYDKNLLGWGLDAVLPITKWRPHLPKVEDKPKSPYDVDAHVSGNSSLGHCANKVEIPDFNVKPIFTQAMSDAGELPPVGSEVIAIVWKGCNWVELPYPVTIAFMGKSNVVYTAKLKREVEVHYVGGEIKFKPIQTEREKAIDKAACLIASKEVLHNQYPKALVVAGILYDAGLLQTPKNNVT